MIIADRIGRKPGANPHNTASKHPCNIAVGQEYLILTACHPTGVRREQQLIISITLKNILLIVGRTGIEMRLVQHRQALKFVNARNSGEHTAPMSMFCNLLISRIRIYTPYTYCIDCGPPNVSSKWPLVTGQLGHPLTVRLLHHGSIGWAARGPFHRQGRSVTKFWGVRSSLRPFAPGVPGTVCP
jgi:hypothetical protein